MERAIPVSRMKFESDFFSSPCFEVEARGKRLRFVESNRLAYKRVESLYAKEPTTIPWLEAMLPNEVLIDIGANIGMYSVYAAAVAGCRVFAFEPEALNYGELNKNIHVNGLHDRVSAFCIALSDETRIGYLYLGAFGFGYSHHDFNENTWQEDKHFGDKVTPKDKRLLQGCVSATLDHVLDSGVVPPPQHIKIDVDGLESRVVKGALAALRHPKLRTVLIEIDHRIPESDAIIDAMVDAGWRYSIDQLRTNRKKILSAEQVEGTRRRKVGGFNYIFYREPEYDRLFADFLADYVPPWGSGS